MTTTTGRSVGADRTDFVVQPIPTRMVFGAGSRRQIVDELQRAGISRFLILTTARGRAMVQDRMPDVAGRAAAVFDRSRTHVPRETVDAALDLLYTSGIRVDGCLAVGGGSTVGLAKSLALESDLPYVAVPTTYAGSEMTSIWGLTDGARKRTGREERVRPASVVYDAELTTDLPVDTTITSGLNAIAHAAEALYAPDGNPLIDAIAGQGIASMVNGLNELIAHPQDLSARGNALYAAAMCGVCLGATAMSLHHKICHVLGGSFGLPHAETHATLLPHVLAFNLPGVPAADRLLRQALPGADEPEQALWDICAQSLTAGSLADLGLAEQDLPQAVSIVLEDLGDPQANPRPVGADDLLTLLTAAWRGDPPRRNRKGPS